MFASTCYVVALYYFLFVLFFLPPPICHLPLEFGQLESASYIVFVHFKKTDGFYFDDCSIFFLFVNIAFLASFPNHPTASIISIINGITFRTFDRKLLTLGVEIFF